MIAMHQQLSNKLLGGKLNFPESSHSTCSRCAGLLVKTFCICPAEGIADFQISAMKCLQCGDLFDSTILENRYRAQHHSPTHKSGGGRL